MPQRGKLDVDGVYWGAEDVDVLAPEDPPVPDDVIRPGAYRWQPPADGQPGHYVPLAPSQVKTAPGGITLEQAFYALVTQGAADARVKAWAADFAKTLDGQG